MGTLDAVEWEPCLLEPVRNAEAERLIRREMGSVPPGARYFLDSPWVTRAAMRLDLTVLPIRHLTPGLAEMIALVVSQDNACRYCYDATRLLMRLVGFPDERIRRLEDGLLGGDLSPADQAALQFARCVSRAAPLATCEDGRRLLDAGYRPDAVRETAALAATYVFFNRLSTAPALPPTDWQERWYMRLLRPFLARSLRPRRAATTVALRPEERRGPFAALVNALDGLPIAPALRAILDDLWATCALPRRTTGLVFAVVARGIGCPTSERDALAALHAEGMSDVEVEQALAHLGAGLDASTQAALSFARESIWYRPASLQRHARAVRAHFTRQEFVELIGLASLANMVCRLGVAAQLGNASA